MEFPCPSCGAELRWSPGQGTLSCPHCGHAAAPPAVEPVADPLEELPLTQAALSAPKGWGTETRSMKCSACGAVHDQPGSVEAARCPFCGAAQLAPEASGDVIRPGSLVPFAIEEKEAVRRFREWLGGLWFRPGSLRTEAQLHGIAGVYVPVWTFDATASSRWTAESGTHYQVEKEVTEVVDGKSVTRRKKVTETRWSPASGTHRQRYDDWLIQASGGLDQAALKGLLPFELDKLRPYESTFLAGFRAERYGVGLDEAWKLAQKEVGGAERSACAAEVPGDTHRNLKVHTSFSEVTFKHVLLPVWIAAYRYQGQVYRYLVNGQTGKATGDAPYSMAKIALAVVVFVVAVLGCMGLLSAFGLLGAAASR